VGLVVDKVALGQVFTEYFSFSCQFAFHRLLHTHHHLSSGAGTIGQTVAAVPSGLILTQEEEEEGTKWVKTEFLGCLGLKGHFCEEAKIVRSLQRLD
jgi:hypothetical protein